MSLNSQGPETTEELNQAAGVAETPEPQSSREDLEDLVDRTISAFIEESFLVNQCFFDIQYLLYAQEGNPALTPEQFAKAFSDMKKNLQDLRVLMFGHNPTPRQDEAFQIAIDMVLGERNITPEMYQSLLMAEAELCGHPR